MKNRKREDEAADKRKKFWQGSESEEDMFVRLCMRDVAVRRSIEETVAVGSFLGCAERGAGIEKDRKDAQDMRMRRGFRRGSSSEEGVPVSALGKSTKSGSVVVKSLKKKVRISGVEVYEPRSVFAHALRSHTQFRPQSRDLYRYLWSYPICPEVLPYRRRWDERLWRGESGEGWMFALDKWFRDNIPHYAMRMAQVGGGGRDVDRYSRIASSLQRRLREEAFSIKKGSGLSRALDEEGVPPTRFWGFSRVKPDRP